MKEILNASLKFSAIVRTLKSEFDNCILRALANAFFRNQVKWFSYATLTPLFSIHTTNVPFIYSSRSRVRSVQKILIEWERVQNTFQGVFYESTGCNFVLLRLNLLTLRQTAIELKYESPCFQGYLLFHVLRLLIPSHLYEDFIPPSFTP